MRHIGDPLTVVRDVGFTRRDARQIDGELLIATHANQIEPALLTDHKQLSSVRTESRVTKHQRAHGELRGLGMRVTKYRIMLTKSPDVLALVARGFKQKIFSIGRPCPTELLSRLVPVRQHRMQVPAV